MTLLDKNAQQLLAKWIADGQPPLTGLAYSNEKRTIRA